MPRISPSAFIALSNCREGEGPGTLAQREIASAKPERCRWKAYRDWFDPHSIGMNGNHPSAG